MFQYLYGMRNKSLGMKTTGIRRMAREYSNKYKLTRLWFDALRQVYNSVANKPKVKRKDRKEFEIIRSHVLRAHAISSSRAQKSF